MGNWRRVWLRGMCHPRDLPALLDATAEPNWLEPSDTAPSHCLIRSASVFGLNNWVAERMDSVGNLYERGYTVANVVETLAWLAQAAPTLLLVVHCGDDYEDARCVATIYVSNGTATLCPPKIAEIPQLGEEAIMLNAVRAVERARERVAPLVDRERKP